MKNAAMVVHTSLGIPFAKPPLGPLQFVPPEPPESLSGVKDGTSHPDKCLQDVAGMDSVSQKLMNRTLPSTSMSEDCCTSTSTHCPYPQGFRPAWECQTIAG